MSLEVAVGILSRGNQLLVCQRMGSGTFPNKWEFPGGKVESGEDAVAALERELEEELGIVVQSAREVFRNVHSYPDGSQVDLRFFNVAAYVGEPRNRVFKHIAWVAVDKLEGLDFLEGDLPVIRELQDGGLQRFF